MILLVKNKYCLQGMQLLFIAINAVKLAIRSTKKVIMKIKISFANLAQHFRIALHIKCFTTVRDLTTVVIRYF